MIQIISKKVNTFRENRRVRETFAHLHPGENSAQRFADYQSRKYFAAGMMIVAGIVAAILVFIANSMGGRLEEGGVLRRNEWGKGSYFVTLSAHTEEGNEILTLEVEERKYTEQEVLRLKEEALRQLQEIIVGNNDSLRQVRENLRLVTDISGYPFFVSWRTSNYQRIKPDGTITLQNLLPEGEEITLTAILTYEQFKWEEEFTVLLLPAVISPEQEYSNNLRELLSENDKLYQTNDKYYLPKSIGELDISWEERKDENSAFILFLGFAGALLVIWGMDRDVQKKDRQRREQLVRNYPDFVSRLQLYMGAGLTVKNAFLKLGKDYQKQKNNTGKKDFLYEEILICNYQFSNGRAEDRIYQEWGKRCGEMHYRKLGFLLTTYLKQGNDKLLDMLSAEMENALEERRNRAKQRGEEMGTKLLFPMMMMLIVVMFLILLPAFADFSGM